MPKSKLFLILFLFSTNLFSQGIGDWNNLTESGNELYDSGNGIILRTKNNKEIQNIKKWFFYHDQIIIELCSGNYVICDEITGETKSFIKKTDFEKYSIENNLKPQFWTRWYSDNWQDVEILITAFVYSSLVSIPITLLFLYLLIIKFKKSNKNNKIKIISISFLIIISFLITYILDIYPTSF